MDWALAVSHPLLEKIGLNKLQDFHILKVFTLQKDFPM
jgi:hypothetical protein